MRKSLLAAASGIMLGLAMSFTAFAGTFTLADLPAMQPEPVVELNGNHPYFTDEAFPDGLSLSPLDSLGRCGKAKAYVTPALLPEEDRGSIGMIKPSGWQTPQQKFDFIDGRFVYNRCHLVAYCLAGNNDPENLVTGTRYLNIDGMLPYEMQILNYVKSGKGNVKYRVTPVFLENELVCRGVVMEAKSDSGDLEFCVFAYNKQPGIDIEFATGRIKRNSEDPAKGVYTHAGSMKAAGAAGGAEETKAVPESKAANEEQLDYVVNTNSNVFHRPDCANAEKISDKNRKKYHGYRSQLITNGYKPGGCCNP